MGVFSQRVCGVCVCVCVYVVCRHLETILPLYLGIAGLLFEFWGLRNWQVLEMLKQLKENIMLKEPRKNLKGS